MRRVRKTGVHSMEQTIEKAGNIRTARRCTDKAESSRLV